MQAEEYVQRLAAGTGLRATDLRCGRHAKGTRLGDNLLTVTRDHLEPDDIRPHRTVLIPDRQIGHTGKLNLRMRPIHGRLLLRLTTRVQMARTPLENMLAAATNSRTTRTPLTSHAAPPK
jgi:hypothetical protein